MLGSDNLQEAPSCFHLHCNILITSCSKLENTKGDKILEALADKYAILSRVSVARDDPSEESVWENVRVLECVRLRGCV